MYPFLTGFKTLDAAICQYSPDGIISGRIMLVCGNSGSGKTSFVNSIRSKVKLDVDRWSVAGANAPEGPKGSNDLLTAWKEKDGYRGYYERDVDIQKSIGFPIDLRGREAMKSCHQLRKDLIERSGFCILSVDTRPSMLSRGQSPILASSKVFHYSADYIVHVEKQMLDPNFARFEAKLIKNRTGDPGVTFRLYPGRANNRDYPYEFHERISNVI